MSAVASGGCHKSPFPSGSSANAAGRSMFWPSCAGFRRDELCESQISQKCQGGNWGLAELVPPTNSPPRTFMLSIGNRKSWRTATLHPDSRYVRDTWAVWETAKGIGVESKARKGRASGRERAQTRQQLQGLADGHRCDAKVLVHVSSGVWRLPW